MRPSSRTSATDSSAAGDWPEGAVEVGRVIGAWGVKGWLKVQAFSADPQALFSARRWWTLPAQNAMSETPAGVDLQGAKAWSVTQCRWHGSDLVAQWQDVADRGTAESLKGLRIFVPRSAFPAPAKDEYYWVDLIGLQVLNRQGLSLGRVHGLLPTGPHNVLRITPEGAVDGDPATEILVPFVDAFVDEVRTDLGRVVVDWSLDD